ncbi:right-handed parallel beta-helix repeat-containing protein [uncultured Methanobacterium sp.]|uniref:right-handed parallel beta-helix repeat-containing protein n=1 Tax=uncultured Methanobacterium sp. TaxID=176306 RepID=UPI002AA616F2|nr:right-handed parallel beta-helix repeat-containing protein [uncultured Methanobacterium sp.]
MIKEKRILQVLLVLIVTFMAVPAIYAADPGNYTSLDGSVQSTASGGTLTLDKNYTYNSTTDSVYASNGISVTKDLVVDGNGYTIDAQNSTRVFQVSNNVKLTLKNLVIKNTVNSAINLLGTTGQLQLINCTMTDCSGSSSFINMPNGASTSSKITLILTNSTFNNGGSAQYLIRIGKNNVATVTNTKFTNNNVAAPKGTSVGIFYIMSSGSVNLINSTFLNNVGSGDGCCVLMTSGGSVSATNSTFINNTAGLRGACFNGLGTITTTNCTFINNSAGDANYGGGAIYAMGTLTVTGCTFINNTATGSGGAISNSAGGTITNSIFINNNASKGAAIDNSGTLTANKNWWGSNSPDFATLISGASAPANWIYMNLSANVPAYLLSSETIPIIANFNYYTDGVNVTPITDGTHIPNGLTVYFQTNNGQITPNKTTVNGLATANYSYSGSESQVNATTDANPNSNSFTTSDFYRSLNFTVNRIIDFTSNVTSGASPLNVQFTSTSPFSDTITIDSYYWNFGDGTYSTEENPTHTYTRAGTYTVSLAVTTSIGNDTMTKTNLITVLSPPVITNNRTGTTYNSIQSAIDDVNTQNGDTLTVSTGNYTENIIVNKNLILTALGLVTIQPLNTNLPVITVTSEGNGSTIQGFNINGSTNSYGISLTSTNNVTIKNNTITGNNVGIQLWNSTHNNITGNNATGNNWSGICLDTSNNNTITNNNVNNNQEGIFIANSAQNNINNNNVSNNAYSGISDIHGNQNTITQNTIQSNVWNGILIQNSTNDVISGNTLQKNTWSSITLDGPTASTITGNNISSSQEGIFTANGATGNTITQNTINNITYTGISILTGSNNNTITLNNENNSGSNGILIQNSNQNTVQENTFSNNGWSGICLDQTNNTTVTMNNLENNPEQGIAVGGTNNTFNSNYWSDWNTTYPRPIDGNNNIYDNNPQTTPYT